jgi:predicted small lipoprotein YifL
MSTIQKFLTLLAIVTGLAGCGAKPPGCADPETLNTMRSFIAEETQKVLDRESADDPEQWIAKYLDGLTVQVSGIVTDGYVPEAKKNMCRGTMKLQTLDGKAMELPVSYSTQRTEEQKGAFLLEVAAFNTIIAPTTTATRDYYWGHRWTGEWRGTFSCAGIGGAADGPHGPFSMPVTMTVQGTAAKLERTTVGGGIEQLEGRFDTMGFDEPFLLQGRGQNTPDDTWRTRFIGRAGGLNLTAEGVITGPRTKPDGEQVWEPLRQCKLNLALTR